jgi:hypothetical protein
MLNYYFTKSAEQLTSHFTPTQPLSDIPSDGLKNDNYKREVCNPLVVRMRNSKRDICILYKKARFHK